MSKKTLFILLLLPFILAISFFAVSSFLVTKVKGDISNIDWEYKNNEVYSIEEGEMELTASPILADRELDADATLTWEVKNVNEEEPVHARVETRDGKAYLVFDSIGSVVVTCTNSSGNISKSFTIKIYDGGVVSINTKRLRSQTSIEGKNYYGEYDLDGSNLKEASFFLDVLVQPADVIEYIKVETSPNIEFNEKTGKVTVKGAGKSYVRYKSSEEAYVETETFEFDVVKDGVNVYNYSDLLECTNRSENGRIVCLQANLESLSATYDENFNKKDDQTELFGTYNFRTKKFNFDKEVYRFRSTYNTEYIDQYNQKSSDKISKDLVVGVHIQKDFYGNGYQINLHNLTYPTRTLATDEYLVALGDDDLFRGPLPYVIIGTNGLPIIKAYAQDNVGFLVDGDGITLRDVNFKNCNYSSTLENNNYTGTVVEVMGDNVTIVNSHLSSGKTVLRSYSNKNVIVKNTLLEKGREFIAKVGTNEYEHIDMTKRVHFTFKGVEYDYSANDFFYGDSSTEWYLNRIAACLIKSSYVTVNSEDLKLSDSDRLALAKIVNGILSDVSLIKQDGEAIVKNDITFEDCMFYQSGIFSIAIDTIFNGPYMFDGSPVKSILSLLEGQGVIIPNNVAGINYATKVKLKGKTEFYDYKTIDQVNLDCLIDTTYLNETINTLLKEMVGEEAQPMTIDDFFPVKTIIARRAKAEGYYYTVDGKDYINTPYAMYGGGINLSSMDLSELDGSDEMITGIKLDIYEEVLTKSALDQSGDSIYKKGANILKKCVSMALGFEPFDLMTYKDGYLFGENVSLNILRARVGK